MNLSLSNRNQPPKYLWEVDCSAKAQTLVLPETLSWVTHFLCDPFHWNSLSLPNPPLVESTKDFQIEFKRINGQKPLVYVLCYPEWLTREDFQNADAYYIPGPHCRQGDLLQAASQAKKPLFIERGSFLSPSDFENAVTRTQAAPQITLIEAGSHFGYGDRVLDPRSLALCNLWRSKFGIDFALSHTDLLESDASNSAYRPRFVNEEHFESIVFDQAALFNCGVVFKSHPRPELGFKYLSSLVSRVKPRIEALEKLRRRIHTSQDSLKSESTVHENF